MTRTDLPQRMAISPPRLDDPEVEFDSLLDQWTGWLSRLDRAEPLLVYLRTRHLPPATLVRLAEALREAAEDDPLVIRGRVDVALAARADGVQLPEAGLPADRVRMIIGDQLLIGRSVHDLDGVREAADAGADWVTLAPIFAPISKPSQRPALGPDVLAEAVTHDIPVFALGGITAENRDDCLRRGAHGVAGITLFDQPPEATTG